MRIKISEDTKQTFMVAGDMIVKAGAIILPIIGGALLKKTGDKLADKILYSGEVTYNQTVRTIMNSSMFDSNKTRVLTILDKNGDSKYYRLIIDIIQSNMFDSNKLNLIEKFTNDLKSEEEA